MQIRDQQNQKRGQPCWAL